ncbi:MAG: hypothetical protein ACREVZ_05220, partial [Burkholderiales bacterium]
VSFPTIPGGVSNGPDHLHQPHWLTASGLIDRLGLREDLPVTRLAGGAERSVRTPKPACSLTATL